MAEQKNPQAQPELSLSEQTRIRREKLTNLQAEGQNPFVITRFDWDATSQQIKDNFDAMEGKPVKVAGRLMSKRGMGKVSFCDLQDRDGRIQLYARQDEMDEEVYKKFKKFDIGDIVGVEGEAFRTQRGEMSVRAKNITLLSKALLPLPEKFHGLQDTDVRYRQRYLDLIVNPQVKETFVRRARIMATMREFFNERGYIEVETPILQPIPGGASARPFITHHNSLDIDLYLRIATELYLKKKNPTGNWAYSMLSQLYVALPFALLNVLAFQNSPETGSVTYNPILPLSIFVFIWLSDTGAYCVGSLIGKHRLFERISPKKSWEGSIGGGIFSIASSLGFAHFFPFMPGWQWVGLAIVVVIFGTWGDLTESLMKRQLGIKDSGNILPGHGGMLDRFDSALMAIPAAVVYLYALTMF